MHKVKERRGAEQLVGMIGLPRMLLHYTTTSRDSTCQLVPLLLQPSTS